MQTKNTGSNLVYQRKLKGYSQKQLSEKTEVTVRTIQRIEKGEVQPHLHTVKLLAAALDIEVSDLIPLDDPKEETIKTKWLLLLHATPLLGFLIPLLNVLIPLFLWIHKREDNKLYDRHGVRVINFQITWLILYVLSIAALITVEKWGFILFVSVLPAGLLIVLANIFYAINTHKCFYPLAIPFLRQKKARITKALLFLFLITGSMGCVAQSGGQISRLDGSSIHRDSLQASIAYHMEEAGVTGLAVSVFNAKEAVFRETFGYAAVENQLSLKAGTNLYGASLSKAVFGVLVMKLVEEGVIDLDTPLESYLPRKIFEYAPRTRWHDDYSDLEQDSMYHKITARMCLAHTSGFPNWRWFEEDKKLRVLYEPGTRFHYSGEGFVYLQVVLEKITGKSLQELAAEKIFTPLGMEDSSYVWEPRFSEEFANGYDQLGQNLGKDTDNEARSGSTLETTSADYTRFLEAILRQELLSAASYRELFARQHRIHSRTQFGPGAAEVTNANTDIGLGYALGWGYLETPYGPGLFKEGHGSGFEHYTILFPETGQGVMILSNSFNTSGIIKKVLETAMRDFYTPWAWEQYIPYDQS